MGMTPILAPDAAQVRLLAPPIPRRDTRRYDRIRPADMSRWKWRGIIIGRTWDSGFTEEDYRLLLVGGRRRRVASPDGYNTHGKPVYALSGWERRERDRLLNLYCLDGFESHNLAVNAGRTQLLNLIASVGGHSGTTYFAVGTGSNAPSTGDTQLQTEFFRKVFSTTTISGNQVDLSTVFNTGEGNTTYAEAGLFGNGATGTANSGTLFARSSYVYTKSSAVTLSNDYFIYLN
jgi:hypothetical protein